MIIMYWIIALLSINCSNPFINLILIYLFLCLLFIFYFFLLRFGSEGCDSFISGMECLMDEAAKSKITDVVLGMAHRGRLSTLFNVIKKPVSQIFAEFEELGKEYKEGEETVGIN